MGYLIKATLGLALFFGAVVLFNVKLQELLDTGTCAEGNVPFEIAPGYECPEGTGTDILLLMGSVFAGLIGAAIFAFRGDPPWDGGRPSVGFFGLGGLAWGIFFAGTGAALLLGSPYGEITDPQTGETVGRPDSQLGATITGITFLVMGTPPLLLGLWNAIKGLGPGEARSAESIGARLPWGSGGTPASGGGDAIGRIERLARLRESGALSDEEFEREKAKVLAEQ